MTRWRGWASIQYLVVGIAAAVRAHGVAAGDFNATGMTTDWLGWRSALLWGAIWYVWGGFCFLAGLFPRSRDLRMTSAISGVVLLYAWSLLVFLNSGQDFTNATMWGFIAFGTIVAFSWGFPSAPLELEHRRAE